MKCLLIILILAFPAFGQEERKLIGEIEFFGYSGIDLEQLRESLPVQEGDEFKIEKRGQLTGILDDIAESVQKVLARQTTDILPVCCDSQGNWIIYIGFSGKDPVYNPKPSENKKLPGKILDLCERFEEQLEDAIKRGIAQEDQSQGYALSIDPVLRKTQLEMREYALDQGDLVHDVLMNAKDDKHRIAAAEILGYAEPSRQQILALVHAARDENRIVRNNATRAFWILANSNTDLAAEVPVEFYIDMLLSNKWTDANKASLALSSITEQNNSEILSRLHRKDVQERLIEMARWRTWHADYAKYVLGRIAGIDEERLKEIVNSGQTDAIINRLSPEPQ